MNFTPQFFLHLAFGLSLLTFGWTLLRFGIGAVGFLSGFLFGFSFYQLIVQVLAEQYPAGLQYVPDNPYMAAFTGLFIGAIGFFFAKRIYQFAVFAGAMSVSLYIVYSPEQRDLLNQLMAQAKILEPLNRTMGNAWPAIFALLLSLIVVYFQKHVIILLTAIAGAFVIAKTIAIPAAFLPLSFAGVLLQNSTKTQKRARKDTSEYDDD